MKARAMMGKAYMLTCSDCGKDHAVFLGCGFSFPNVYSRLVEDIEAGRFGEEWRELAAQTECYAIDAEDHLFRCEECGYWECAPGLSIYAPKDAEVALERGDRPYVTAWELEEGYTLVRERVHECGRCGQKMRMFAECGAQRAKLKCLECGGELERSPDYILWD